MVDRRPLAAGFPQAALPRLFPIRRFRPFLHARIRSERKRSRRRSDERPRLALRRKSTGAAGRLARRRRWSGTQSACWTRRASAPATAPWWWSTRGPNGPPGSGPSPAFPKRSILLQDRGWRALVNGGSRREENHRKDPPNLPHIAGAAVAPGFTRNGNRVAGKGGRFPGKRQRPHAHGRGGGHAGGCDLRPHPPRPLRPPGQLADLPLRLSGLQPLPTVFHKIPVPQRPQFLHGFLPALRRRGRGGARRGQKEKPPAGIPILPPDRGAAKPRLLDGPMAPAQERQEHYIHSRRLRPEEGRRLIVVEGQARGAETQRVGGEVKSSPPGWLLRSGRPGTPGFRTDQGTFPRSAKKYTLTAASALNSCSSPRKPASRRKAPSRNWTRPSRPRSNI